MFSSNVRIDKQRVLSAILGVTNGINTGRYLGLPSLIGRSKRVTFSYIKDIIWKRIQGWRNKLLSQAGKGVLIKSIAQAIPTYSMSDKTRPRYPSRVPRVVPPSGVPLYNL